MRLFLFLSALFAALTGPAASAHVAAPLQVAGPRQAGQVIAPAHAIVIAAAGLGGVARDVAATPAPARAPGRAIPLYQDRLRE